MNLITKLLMENKVNVYDAVYVDNGIKRPALGLVIIDVDKSYINKLPSKVQLLSEVRAIFFVSKLEWELLNYWKDMGVKQIRKYEHNDDIKLVGFNDYYQHIIPNPLFKFLERGKAYYLNDLISHCALIEG